MIKDADAGLKHKLGRPVYLWTGARNLSARPVKAKIEMGGRGSKPSHSSWDRGQSPCPRASALRQHHLTATPWWTISSAKPITRCTSTSAANDDRCAPRSKAATGGNRPGKARAIARELVCHRHDHHTSRVAPFLLTFSQAPQPPQRAAFVPRPRTSERPHSTESS